MSRRKKIANFDRSEPEFLISYLDRHDDWAVVVCLVGGGQEIHTGEAGIGEWLEAVQRSVPALARSCIARTSRIPSTPAQLRSRTPWLGGISRMGRRLHLATSMRSFRSEKVSAFVKAVLDCDTDLGPGIAR